VSELPEDAAAALAEPKEAAAEVIAGRPGPTARRWLGPAALVVSVLFAIDTYLVVANQVLPFDVPIARFIQQLDWGPVVYPMELINASSGVCIKLVISRQRPPADLVHILSPTTGFSYPSGHAVFFTWMSFMVAVSLAPKIRPGFRPILWTVAAIVIVLTCFARVWAGAHWPSDVIGGVLLAIGWSAFVLWLPERWLPSPTFRWFRGRARVTS